MSPLSIAPYFPFPRVRLVHQEVMDIADGGMAVMTFEPDGRYSPVCSSCGAKVSSVHSSSARHIRDLTGFGAHTILMIPNRKLRCDCCGVRVERHDFVDKHGRLTCRLVRAVEDLLTLGMTIRAAAEHFGLHWHTVKEIDKRRLRREVGTPNFDGLRILAVDEIAVHKGHRYKTIVYDYENGRIVWVGDGRSYKTLRKFFLLLTPEQLASIQAVAIDMSQAYAKAIKKFCPGAAIVYDLFHILAKYGREVIDPVRKEEFRKSTGPERELIKGSKYLLLSNRQNLSRKKRFRLADLMLANRDINIAYVMREQLKQIWKYRSEAWAYKALFTWCQLADESGVPRLRRFAKNLLKHIEGILSHCRFPISTSPLEGVNNTIKVIKRVAYGYRDDEYFALKIMFAFRGRSPQPNPR